MCKREKKKNLKRRRRKSGSVQEEKKKKKKRMSKWEIRRRIITNEWEIPPKIWLAVVKITTKVEPISSMIDTEPTLPQKCKK